MGCKLANAFEESLKDMGISFVSHTLCERTKKKIEQKKIHLQTSDASLDKAVLGLVSFIVWPGSHHISSFSGENDNLWPFYSLTPNSTVVHAHLLNPSAPTFQIAASLSGQFVRDLSFSHTVLVPNGAF